LTPLLDPPKNPYIRGDTGGGRGYTIPTPTLCHTSLSGSDVPK